MFILRLPLDNKTSPRVSVPEKAAHALRRRWNPLDWAALVLTAPGLACDCLGGWAGAGARGLSPGGFRSRVRGPWLLRETGVRSGPGAARLPGDVAVHGGPSVQENDDSHHGGGDEHLRVDAQPGEVQADLLPEILPTPQGKAGDTVTLVPHPEGKIPPRPLPSQGHHTPGTPCPASLHQEAEARRVAGGAPRQAVRFGVPSAPRPVQPKNGNDCGPEAPREPVSLYVEHPGRPQWAELRSPQPHGTHAVCPACPFLPQDGGPPPLPGTRCPGGNSFIVPAPGIPSYLTRSMGWYL